MKQRMIAIPVLVTAGAVLLALGTLDDKVLNSRGSFFLNIDADNNESGQVLVIARDTTGVGGTRLLTIEEDGTAHLKGADARFILQDDDDELSMTEFDDFTANLFSINKYSSTGPSLMDLSPVPADGVSQAKIRLFRATDTTALKALQLFKGDGSATVDTQFGVDGTDSYFQVSGGNVGIGTNSPTSLLDVRLGAVRASRNDVQYLEILDDSSQGATITGHSGEANKKSLVIRNLHNGAGAPAGETFIRFQVGNELSPVNALQIAEDGNIGIGTTLPETKLHIQGGAPLSLGGGGFAVMGSTAGLNLAMDNNEIMVRINGSPGDLFLNAEGGNILMGGTGSIVRVPVLEITGADLAEKFPVSEEVTPGMVVEIDPANPGELCVSRGAYNRRVAGVVSGANDLPAGAILGNLPGLEDAPAIALSGRVWVWCDATQVAIEPGDLLTTSGTPGHAMKVSDHTRAQGAILGKAMSSLESGRGLVLVLVTLQ